MTQNNLDPLSTTIDLETSFDNYLSRSNLKNESMISLHPSNEEIKRVGILKKQNSVKPLTNNQEKVPLKDSEPTKSKVKKNFKNISDFFTIVFTLFMFSQIKKRILFTNTISAIV